MGSFTDALSDVVGSVVAFIVLIVLAVVAFYLTVFVIGAGAALAGYTPSGDFIVLSSALIVAASVLAGALNTAR